MAMLIVYFSSGSPRESTLILFLKINYENNGALLTVRYAYSLPSKSRGNSKAHIFDKD